MNPEATDDKQDDKRFKEMLDKLERALRALSPDRQAEVIRHLQSQDELPPTE